MATGGPLDEGAFSSWFARRAHERVNLFVWSGARLRNHLNAALPTVPLRPKRRRKKCIAWLCKFRAGSSHLQVPLKGLMGNQVNSWIQDIFGFCIRWAKGCSNIVQNVRRRFIKSLPTKQTQFWEICVRTKCSTSLDSRLARNVAHVYYNFLDFFV